MGVVWEMCGGNGRRGGSGNLDWYFFNLINKKKNQGQKSCQVFYPDTAHGPCGSVKEDTKVRYQVRS